MEPFPEISLFWEIFMHVMHTALSDKTWENRSLHGKDLREYSCSSGFPEKLFGSLFPCVCILGFDNGSLYFHSVCIDICPEPEKESLDYGLFLVVSENHGSRIDHYTSVFYNGDATESKQAPVLGITTNIQMFSSNGNLVLTKTCWLMF